MSCVEFRCPRCEEMFVFEVDRPAAGGAPRCCRTCCLDLGVQAEPPQAGTAVERCWLCGNGEFYIQKDFNRRLGFSIVIGSALTILLVMLLAGHIVGIYCLLGVALLDWLAYQLLSNVTVCYLCQSIYRGFPLNPDHAGFYLGNEEKHKKLRQLWFEKLLLTPDGESKR